MLEKHICKGMEGYQVIYTRFPPNAAGFFNKPAEDQGQGLQDLVFLYREKTNNS